LDGSITFEQLEVGESKKILLKGDVLPSLEDGHIIKEEVSISSDIFDDDFSNNTFNIDVEISRLIELSIIQIDNPDPVIAGNMLTYSIVVKNLGPSYASGVKVKNFIYYQAFSGVLLYSLDGGHSWNTFLGEIDIGEIKNNDSVHILWKGRVEQTFSGNIINKVEVSGNENDSFTGNNVSIENTGVIMRGDLEIRTTATPLPAIAGNDLSYNLVIKNNGPSVSSSVLITDKIFPKLENVVFFDGYSWRPWNGGFTIPRLMSGESFEVLIRGKVKTSIANGEVIFNKAMVDSSGVLDEFKYNNISILKAEVVTSADLEIKKGDSPDPVIAGEDLMYRIKISNLGPSDARNVTVEDLLPPQIQSPVFSLDGSSFGEFWTGKLNVGEVRVGETRILLIRGEVNTLTHNGTLLKNYATVSGSDNDPNLNNNNNNSVYISGLTETSVLGITDLCVESASDNGNPESGDVINLKIKVENKGPDDCGNVYVRDPLLPGIFLFVESEATKGVYEPSTYIWKIGSMEKGEVETLNIKVKFLKNGIFRNFCSVFSDRIEIDSTDNESYLIFNCNEKFVDISLDSMSSVKNASNGDEFIYHVLVRNMGNKIGHNLVISTNLDSSLSIVDYNLSSGNFNIDSGNWYLSKVLPGEEKTLDLKVRFNGSGKIKSIFYLKDLIEEDFNSLNNSSVVAFNGDVTFADLSVLKVMSKEAAYGVNLFFVVRIRNLGNEVSHNIILKDALPNVFDIENIFTTRGFYDLDNFTWSIDEMASGEDVIMVMEVKPISLGDFTNIALIDSLRK